MTILFHETEFPANPTTRRYPRTRAEAFKGPDYTDGFEDAHGNPISFHGAMRPQASSFRPAKGRMNPLVNSPTNPPGVSTMHRPEEDDEPQLPLTREDRLEILAITVAAVAAVLAFAWGVLS
jgi:hypothetical protein